MKENQKNMLWIRGKQEEGVFIIHGSYFLVPRFVALANACIESYRETLPPVMLVPPRCFITMRFFGENHLNMNCGDAENENVVCSDPEYGDGIQICITYSDLADALREVYYKISDDHNERFPEKQNLCMLDYRFSIRISKYGVETVDTEYAK